MAGHRILLVDDEGELVFTMAERLALRGHQVDAVTSGAEALERVGEAEYDIAVVDVKMPGVSGLTVLDHIIATRPALPVILLTGHGVGDDRREGLDHGAAAYLYKPVNIRDLIAAMNEAIGAGS